MNITNSPFSQLSAHLLDLLEEIKDNDIRIVLVGGFGLFLRRQFRSEERANTLIPNYPTARATEDFDILLALELLADSEKMTALNDALKRLGYTPYDPMYQFIREGTAVAGGKNVKVDLLAPKPTESVEGIKLKGRRVKGSPLHARVTPEAIAVNEDLIEISVEGHGTNGQPLKGTVWLPNPYTLMLMKLFAFRDEATGKSGKPGDRSGFARKHAQDLYMIVALLTREETKVLERLTSTYRAHAISRETAQIVAELFANEQAPGSLMLREELGYSLPLDNLRTFLDMLRDTFPQPKT